MRAILQNSADRNLLFLMVDSTDHLTGKTGLTPTVLLSKNGGTFASPAGAVTEVGRGWYRIAANATDSDTLGSLVVSATATGADPSDTEFEVVAFNPQTAWLTSLGATAPANWINASAIASSAFTAAKFDTAALNGKGDWNIGKTGYALAADQAVNVSKVGGTAVSGPNDLKADISNLVTTSQLNARTLAAADYFDPATDAVSLQPDQGVNIVKVAGATAIAEYSVVNFPQAIGTSFLSPVNVGQVLMDYGTAKTSDVTAIPAAVWSHASRTLSAFGFSVTVGTNNDKTGYSLTQAFPSNFASLGINTSGHVSRVTLVDTTTVNTDMRGTDGALLAANYTTPANSDIAAIKAKTDNLPAAPAAVGDVSPTINFSPTISPTTLDGSERGAIATAVRSELNTELGRIDVAISTRSTFAGGAVASVTSPVTVGANNDKTGYSLTQAFPSNFASLGINDSGHISRVTLVDTTTTNTDMRGTNNALLAANYTTPDNAGIAAIKLKTDTLPANPASADDVSPTIDFSPNISPTSLDATERTAIATAVRAAIDTELLAIVSTETAVGQLETKAEADARQLALLAAVDDVSGGTGGGASPEDIWTHPSRTLTSVAAPVEVVVDAQEVADAVLSTILTTALPAGSFGRVVYDIGMDVKTLSYTEGAKVVRTPADTRPIYFVFPAADAVLTGTKSINGAAATPIVGSIAPADIGLASNWYSLAYDAADRATSPGDFIVYTITDGDVSMSILLNVSQGIEDVLEQTGEIADTLVTIAEAVDGVAAEVGKIPRSATPLAAGSFQFTIVGGQSLAFYYSSPL